MGRSAVNRQGISHCMESGKSPCNCFSISNSKFQPTVIAGYSTYLTSFSMQCVWLSSLVTILCFSAGQAL